jgi:hypothetical protein
VQISRLADLEEADSLEVAGLLEELLGATMVELMMPSQAEEEVRKTFCVDDGSEIR